MLAIKLKHRHIILASASPRRQEFLKQLRLPFRVEVREVKEVFPPELQGAEIADYLAILKANAFPDLKPGEILLTGDTIVWHKGRALGKPATPEEAKTMLHSLSGDCHEVISSVCFKTEDQQLCINDTCKVWFKTLREEEINHYVDHYQTADKAGAYGIQDWIGLIGVEKIKGSYNTVMGFPTHLVYKTLMQFANR